MTMAEIAAETRTPPTDSKWYVVHAYSGHEEKVRANLLKRVESMDMSDKIFDVLVPTEEVIEIKDGQRRKVARRIFPGYILVNTGPANADPALGAFTCNALARIVRAQPRTSGSRRYDDDEIARGYLERAQTVSHAARDEKTGHCDHHALATWADDNETKRLVRTALVIPLGVR